MKGTVVHLSVLLGLAVLASGHVCPDLTSCGQGESCCQTEKGYGCCPVDSLCVGGSCLSVPSSSTKRSQYQELPFFKALNKSRASQDPQVVPCPDGSFCPDASTCCPIAPVGYGCCPLIAATCCSDGQHCCPNGYICCFDGQHCCPVGTVCGGTMCYRAHKVESNQQHFTTNMVKKIISTKVSLKNVPCGGGASCPDGNTCCTLSTGEIGCCPLPDATCCDDGLHCCPNGYQCSDSGCYRSHSEKVPWSVKQPAYKRPPLNLRREPQDTPCPQGGSCPDGDTCCTLYSGETGCCPLPDATCCDDGLHCCPNGYVCTESGCNPSGNEVVSRLAKHPAQRRIVLNKNHHRVADPQDIPCPQGGFCPDEATCCTLASGQTGCCPLPDATCCDDGLHCCPNGYQCSDSGCYNSLNSVVPWSARHPAHSRANVVKKTKLNRVNDVPCGGGYSCPNGNTCCTLASGEQACCPLPQATCCQDGVHCCPNGYSCGSTGCYSSSNDAVPWSVKQSAIRRMSQSLPVDENLQDVPCPGGESCPDGNTCCTLASGEEGCCPLPYATCCPDHEHCCPNGYTCSDSGCSPNRFQQFLNVTRMEAVSSKQRHNQAAMTPKKNTKGMTIMNVFSKLVPCGGGVYCQDGQTCCMLASGEWGCCPYENASCCSDGVHCCPSGTTCSSGACV